MRRQAHYWPTSQTLLLVSLEFSSVLLFSLTKKSKSWAISPHSLIPIYHSDPTPWDISSLGCNHTSLSAAPHTGRTCSSHRPFAQSALWSPLNLFLVNPRLPSPLPYSSLQLSLSSSVLTIEFVYLLAYLFLFCLTPSIVTWSLGGRSLDFFSTSLFYCKHFPQDSMHHRCSINIKDYTRCPSAD